VNRVSKILSHSKGAFSQAGKSFGFIAFGMGVLIFLTKITALVKLQILTVIFGIRSSELDLFNAANAIPEFIFTIVVIGGINAALIPVFNQTSLNESEDRLKKVFSTIVNIFILVLFTICILVFIFAPQIISLTDRIRLANIENDLSLSDFQLFVDLLRILIFSPIILCVSSIFSSILQVKRSFWITALAPLFYNLGIIGASVLLTYYDNNIIILAYGVLFASLLHFAIQLPAILKTKVQYTLFAFNAGDAYVKRAITNTLPRIIGLTSDNIANIFQTFIALALVQGSLNSFRLATSLRDLPSSIFGLAVAQSVFPQMSELAEKKEFIEFQKLFSLAIRTILFWTIPVTAIFIVLRTPIVQLLFGLFNKEITFSDTSLVSYSLLFLSLGIIFYSILAVVNRAFYSLNDSTTPTTVSIFVIFVELALTYTLVNLFSHFDESLSLNPIFVLSNIDNYFQNGNSQAAIGGIALAGTIAVFFNLSILIWALKRKGTDFFYESQFIFNKFLSGFVTILIGFLGFKYLNDFFDTTRVIGVFLSTLNISLIMCLTYYLSEKYLRDEDVKMFDNFLKKIGNFLRKVKEAFSKNEVIGVGTSS